MSIKVFLLIILALGIIGALVKSLIKFVVSIIIVLFLFRLGFLWGPNDISEKLNLSNFINSKYRTQVETTITDMQKRVNDNSIVDTNKLYNKATEYIKDEITQYLQK